MVILLGIGGASCPFDEFNIFMGGGGGAGSYNTYEPFELFKGYNGGGIIYIHAKHAASFSGVLTANGESGVDHFLPDGGGGGN